MMPLETIKTLDRNSVLHPFTQAADHASGKVDPYVVQTGSGVRIRGADGSEFIDGFAGLYCANIGYGNEEVADAIAAQARELAYYHSYAGHTTEQLAVLSDRLIRMAPGVSVVRTFGADRGVD